MEARTDPTRLRHVGMRVCGSCVAWRSLVRLCKLLRDATMFDVVATAGLRLRPTSTEQVSNIELYGVMVDNAGQ